MKVTYYGYFTPFGGYGIVNLAWVKYLRRAGVEVFPHRKFEVRPGSAEWNALDDEEKEIFSLPFKKQRIGICETTPYSLGLIDTEIKIANTMCEADFIGNDWAMKLNGMDHIIVPNAWNKWVFKRSGVRKPITVIPHGQDHNLFTYVDRRDRIPEFGKKRKFRFGIVGYLNDRKGVFELIQAFASEFQKGEPVELYLKSSNKAFGYYKNFTDKRIITDVRHLPMPQLVELYQSFDCFVFPSRAEGVGNPPREAILTGCPTIATNYSGLEELAPYIRSLEPSGMESRIDMVDQPGKWAVIDIQNLMWHMRRVYDDYEKELKRAERARNWMIKNFAWEKVTDDLIKFLNKL